MKFHKDGSLPEDAGVIFVFGSNLIGVHGAGAAKEARKTFSAELGVGVGMTGQSYAIPTKDKNIRTMPLDQIASYVKYFVQFTKNNPDINFWVTRVGCGLAGYKDSQIAPMFKGCGNNCNMPDQWEEFLKEKEDNIMTENDTQELLETLKTQICAVNFTKKDGTTRYLICTRDLNRIPVEFRPKGIETPSDPKPTTSVFDVDLQKWRSFINNTVTSWSLTT